VHPHHKIVAVLAALCLVACSPEWTLPLPALDRVPLSVTQPAGDAVFTVGGALGSTGQALFLRYDGSSWHAIPVATDATLWWVFARSPSDVYAVGERGSAFHWSGATPTAIALPTTATLYGVWGASDDDLWIVGGTPDLDGVILHRDANGWHDLTPADVHGALFKVWGASANDVFICGQDNLMLHWNGSALTPQTVPVAPPTSLFTVAGRSSADVYAVGGLANAVALHYDGSAWSNVNDKALASAPGLTGVSVDDDGSVVFVGGAGTKLRGRSGALVDDTALATQVDLHGASLRNGEIFTVGGNYNAPAPTARHGVVAHFGGSVGSTIK
jgi:photosystem II stability/assembly factor-like uncharacterized protein